MTIWKRTLEYLGLGPDEAYDDFDDYVDEDVVPARTRRGGADHEARGRGRGEVEDEDLSQSIPARPSFPSRDFDASVAARQGRDDSGVQLRPSRTGPTVRPTPVQGEPHTVRPRRFDQAQEVADKFKEGQPVIMNLENTDREVSRRLIDFASGLCYALDGTMEKVATGVYLLKPHVRAVQIDEFAD